MSKFSARWRHGKPQGVPSERDAASQAASKIKEWEAEFGELRKVCDRHATSMALMICH